MDDEFLYRFRRQPAREFAQRLKAKLDRQRLGRFSLRSIRGAALTLVVAGTALAITTVSMQSMRLVPHEPTKASASEQESTPGVPGNPGPSNAGDSQEADQRASQAAAGDSQTTSGSPAANPRSSGAPEATSAVEGRSPGTGVSPTTRGGGALDAPESGGLRNYIRIVGTQDVRPYVERAIDAFNSARRASRKPVLEVMSLPDALPVFCGGTGLQHPDILATFERLSPNASAACVQNEVGEVVELKVRYEIAVLVRSVLYGPMVGLSPRHVFLALAKEVPNPERPQELIENPYRTWSEIDGSLEPDPIRVIHRQSGYGSSTIAPILEAGCNDFQWIATLKSSDPERHAQICYTTRDVGVTVQGELISFLQTYPTVLGVLDYRMFDTSRGNVVGMPLRGVEPVPETIKAGTYPGSRALYLYVKRAQVRSMSGMGVREFVQLFFPLMRDWPLPFSDEEWSTMRERVNSL